MIRPLPLLMLPCTLWATLAVASGPDTPTNSETAVCESHKLGFRYVIFENFLGMRAERVCEADADRAKIRTLGVLMDPKAFSERNLRQLFSALSERFPKPEFMIVWVLTSLEQIETPEEREWCEKEESFDMPWYRHHRAYFHRGSEQSISYTVKPSDRETKTVYLKGDSSKRQ